MNLSATPDFKPAEDGLGFIARKQSATLFNYTVDVSFNPEVEDEEAGISVFLTQFQHIDLGIVNLPANSGTNTTQAFRFRVEASGKPNITVPETVVIPIPNSWRSDKIRLSVSAVSDSLYVFGVAPASRPGEYRELGSASALIVSGGTGPFTGELSFDIGSRLKWKCADIAMQAPLLVRMLQTTAARGRHLRTSAGGDILLSRKR